MRAYFIVASEIFAPADPDADWWRWVQLSKFVGWLIFTYVVFDCVAGIL